MLYAACEQQGWVLRRAPVSAFYRKASLGSCVVCPPPLFTALWRPQAARGLYAPSGAARFYSRGPTRRIPGLCPQPPDFRVGTPRTPLVHCWLRAVSVRGRYKIPHNFASAAACWFQSPNPRLLIFACVFFLLPCGGLPYRNRAVHGPVLVYCDKFRVGVASSSFPPLACLHPPSPAPPPTASPHKRACAQMDWGWGVVRKPCAPRGG